MKWMRFASLRQKIAFGYGLIALLAVALSLASLFEMQLVESQIAANERVHEFLSLTLEIRRFEKNYFLYRHPHDLEENRRYLAAAQQTLAQERSTFEDFASRERVEAMASSLSRYAKEMDAEAADKGRHEASLRQLGKEIVSVAEEWQRAGHHRISAQLAQHRRWLLLSCGSVLLLTILVGGWLSRRVVRPLLALEQHMNAVAAGQRARLEISGEAQEIVSLTAAFNRMLDELQARQGELVRSEKLAALGTLLAGVAHEINNPLSNISTSCEILAEEIEQKDCSLHRELLEQIDQETWRARRIVRSLLDYAREREFQREPLTLSSLVEESLRLFKGQLPAKVSIAIDIASDLTVIGDKQRLQQALFNLLRNALDACAGAGNIAIAARRVTGPFPQDALVIRQSSRAPAIELEIRDDGLGIPAEVLPHIFDPFFTTKEVGRGSGLGLFIVFEIIEEHDGAIAVTSRPGQGSRFLIRLHSQDEANEPGQATDRR